MSKRWTVLVLAGALSVIGGCGDNVEMRMQRAQIALQSNKPDQALELAATVLKEQPENVEAVNVVAAAQLRLGRLDAAKQTLADLLARQPDSEEAHRMMISWSFHRLTNVLRKSDFAENQGLQDDFDEVTKLGLTHVDWLHNHQKKAAEADYMRALFAERDVQRLRQLLARKSGSIQNIQLPGENNTNEPVVDRTGQLEGQIRQRLDDVDGHLRRALEGKPNHFQAADLRLELLRERQLWPDFVEQSRQVAAQKDVPATLSEEVVTGLALVPRDVLATAEAVELGRSVQKAVSEKGQKTSNWMLTEGRLLVMESNFPEAEKMLRQALQQKPKDVEARYLMGYTLLQLNKLQEAKQIMDKLAVDAPRASRIQTLYGMVLMRLGDKTLARDVLRRAIEMNPNDPAARETMVVLMAEEGSLAAAETDVNEYLNRNPTDPRALQLKLQFERSNADKAGVTELLTRIESMSPRLDQYLVLLAEGYGYLNRFNDVERIGLEMIQRQPQDATGYMQVASARLAQGKVEEARKLLTEMAQRFPDAKQIDAMLGKLYVRNNDFDRAIEVLEKHLQDNPSDVEARVALAQAFASLAMSEEALDQIKQVLEANPRDLAANGMAARIYAITGKPDLAREHLAQIDESSVNERQQPALLAQLRLAAGDTEEARAICSRAIAQGNDDPILRLILAGLYQRAGSPSDAEVHLLALVRSQPNSPQAFNMLYRFYAGNRMVDKGMVELERLQSLNELYARITQAQLLATVRRFDDAANALDPMFNAMVRTADRQSLYAGEALARIHAANGNLAKALSVYQRLIDARMYTNEARLRQFDLSFANDDAQTRVQKLDALAGALEPTQMGLVRAVSQRYAMSGKPQAGVALIEQWLSRNPNNPSLLLWKGDLFVRMEQYREAADIFRLAVAAAPGNVELHRRLALSLESSGDFPAAEQAFRQLAELGGSAKVVGLTDLGRMYVTIGLNRQAMRVFTELEREGRSRDPRILLTMGRAHMALKRYEQAGQKLAEVPSYSPQFVQAQVLLARVEQAQGLLEAAQKRIGDLARDSRYAPVAARETLRLQMESKQHQEMLTWIDQSLALESLVDADRAQWLRLRINILATQRRWEPVLDAVEQLARLEPNNLLVRAGRLALMVSMQRVEQARRLYKDDSALQASVHAAPLNMVLGLPNAATTAPTSPYYRYLLALADGDSAAALAALEQLPPLATSFHHDLKQTATRSDLASADFKHAMRDVVAAALCIESGLTYAALDLTKSATMRLPNLMPAWALTAEALAQTSQPLLPTLNDVRKLEGTSLALLLQAEDLNLQQRFAEGVAPLQRLLEQNPGNPHVLYRLAGMLQGKGDYAQTITVLEQLLTSRSIYDVPARNDLAYLLAEHQPQRMDQAYELAKQALSAAPRSAAMQDTLAWVQHLRGKHAEALTLISRSLTEIGSMVEVQFHAGSIYKALGNDVWARYYLEEAANASGDKMEKKRAQQLLAR